MSGGPGRASTVDGGPYLVAGDIPRDTGHQQRVVIGIFVPHGGDDGQGDGLLVERAAGG